MVLPLIKFYSIGHLVRPLFHTLRVNSTNNYVLFLYSLQHVMLHLNSFPTGVIKREYLFSRFLLN